ncbi:thioesterase family protein [Gryllotalpicola sp.]|uniref:thioesterase family protein n=1 Tax=Gryllotalpicola sp. TaxID=1932787 RepID=UPI00261F49E0|nr:thioesterase family protein [Gryllotalpicola sp.]
MPAYFERLGDARFRMDDAVRGSWSPNDAHIAPVLGLVAHIVEHHRDLRRSDGLQIGRIAYDIFGTMDTTVNDILDAEVRIVRPGRTIELVEVTLTHRDRVSVLAHAWLMHPFDTAHLAGSGASAMPTRDSMAEQGAAEAFESFGFVKTIDMLRKVDKPGHGWAWMRPQLPLLEGERVSATARALGVVDVANGVGPLIHPKLATYPNIDLTAHVFAEPRGQWVGFETTASFGPTGMGLTSSMLYDEEGTPFGGVHQMNTVRPR